MAKVSASQAPETRSTRPAKSGPAKASSIGAPAQHNQSSRKGKKAWRKHVNLEDVEKGLEEMRTEERVVGTALQNLKDSDLFKIDVKGDDSVRHHLPKFSSSQLTSAKIVAQRSAVPAVFSRTSSTAQKRKAAVSREEKERLLKIAKRPRKGPFNSIMDPSELKSGEGVVELSEAVKQSGNYDPWATELEPEELKDGLETVQRKKFKPPVVDKPRDLIDVPAIVEPHQGTSYNPPAEAHQELLFQAFQNEEKRVREAEKMAEVKQKMESARREAVEEDQSVPQGMKLDKPSLDADEEQEDGEEGDRSNYKLPKPKTKSQKNKESRVLAEKRALAERAARKQLLASIDQVKSLRKATDKLVSEREQLHLQKRLALQEKLRKKGLAGEKLGRHKVPETEIDVQLGEDLTESLRGLKPEGNLFRDRFKSLQQRALIEPRVLVMPKRRRLRIVEYEKHAWKRFE